MESGVKSLHKLESFGSLPHDLDASNNAPQHKSEDQAGQDKTSRDQTQEKIAFEYTSILLNTPPSLNVARAAVLCLFFVIGSVCSYQFAIILELQEKGATFRDQAIFTISGYPFIIKILFAPLVDLFYFDKIGKCKTWIVSATSVLSLMLILVAPNAEVFVQPSKIAALTAIWFSINLIVVLLTISGEMLIVKIFEENDKSKGSMLLDLGWTIGGFFSYNIFVPLNSVDWLNANIFKENHISQPIVSHKAMVFGLATMAFLYAVVVLIFLGEKKTEVHFAKPSFYNILRRVGKFFTQPTMRNFIGYLAAVRIFRYLISDVLILKFINSGITKTTIVNIDTITFPLYIISSIFFMRFMVKGKVMKLYSYFLVYIVFLLLCSYLVLKDLQHHQTEASKSRTVTFLLIISALGRLCVDGPFILGFINLITPLDMGSTFITFMMCWQNLTQMVPSTIGLDVIHQDIFNFDAYVVTCLLLHLVLVIVLMPYSFSLDSKDKDR